MKKEFSCPNCNYEFGKDEIVVADTEIGNLAEIGYHSHNNIELALTCANCEKKIVIKLTISKIEVVRE